MANYKTGAQRYNDKMDKIFKKSEELGHHGLHSESHSKHKALKKASKDISNYGKANPKSDTYKSAQHHNL